MIKALLLICCFSIEINIPELLHGNDYSENFQVWGLEKMDAMNMAKYADTYRISIAKELFSSEIISGYMQAYLSTDHKAGPGISYNKLPKHKYQSYGMVFIIPDNRHSLEIARSLIPYEIARYVLFHEFGTRLPSFIKIGICAKWENQETTNNTEKTQREWKDKGIYPDAIKVINFPFVSLETFDEYVASKIIIKALIEKTTDENPYSRLFDLAEYDIMTQGLEELYGLTIEDLDKILKQ